MQATVTAATVRTENSALALSRRFPGVVAAHPRYALTTLPTPVHRLDRLVNRTGACSLWVKRDDVSSVLYGGNKPRKLEWLLGEARRRGRRSVITFGGTGTHHGLATTIAARDAGLRSILVLLPQPVTDSVRRALLLDRGFGAEMHLASSVPRVVATALRLLARGAWHGDRPFIIPTGGTSSLGCLGYVEAALELAEQVRAAEIPEPDSIFVPLGSGGTVAGLLLGLKLAGLRSRVVGVLVTDLLPPSERKLFAIARACWRRMRRAEPSVPDVELRPEDLTIVPGFVGRGYGVPTEEARQALRAVEGSEGIRLETTYTGKCMAALLRLSEEEPYRGQKLLFWNTYSSIDPEAGLPELPSFRDLPPAFHPFF
jgi:D-cysteine desulfhydrase